MKVILDIGDQKTGSKSRQSFLMKNKSKLSQNGIGVLQATKVETRAGGYDAGLMAYVGKENFIDVFRKKHDVSADVNVDEFIEYQINKEISETTCRVFVFSFEGLMHLKPEEIDKLTSMLRRYFSEIVIVGFLRRQDRKAVSSYTTRIKNQQATDLNVLYNPKGGPRGTNYYNCFKRWEAFIPKRNIIFADYDKCKDVTKTFASIVGLPDNLIFEESRQNTSMSALGCEILRRFNEELSGKDEYKNRRARVAEVIRDYYIGETFRPAKSDAEKLFLEYSKSNKELAKIFDSSEEYFFDQDFSEYPDVVTPLELTLDEVDSYIKEALKESKR